MHSLRDRLTDVARATRRHVLARRRLLAAGCATVAVLAGLRATAAPPPPSVPVTVAAHDLAAGTRLTTDDVHVERFAPGTVPDGGVRDPSGRTLAAPLRRGEPVTDAQLLGPALARGSPGDVVVPVRLSDAAMVDLLRVGDRIDLISTDPQTGSSTVLAARVTVLGVPPPSVSGDVAASAAGLPGRLVLLGASSSAASAVSGASVTHFLTFAFDR